VNSNHRQLLNRGVAGAGILVLGLSLFSAAQWAAGLVKSPFAWGTTTASGPVVLQQIQRLNRLETCRYNGEVVVRGESKRGILPTWVAGDRVLMVGRGEVVAGLDLSGLKSDDVRVNEGRVTIRLPQPTILHTRLDNRGSEVFDRQSGLFSGPDPKLEGEVRGEAEDRIRAAALESGILRTAESNARNTIGDQLRLLGFRDVQFL
jgi:hypothetical protein